MKKRSLVICLASFVAGCGNNNPETYEEPTDSIKEPVAGKPKNQPTVLKPEPEPSALLEVWEKAGFQSGWMRLQNDLAVSFSSSLDGANASRAVPGFAYRAHTQSFGAFVAVEKWDSLPKPTGKFGLDLTGTQVTDVGLKEVAKFQRLTMLCLQLCGKITDSGFKEVAKLQQLTSVNLESSNVSDAGLKELAQLTELNLNECKKITDAGLKEIAKLQKLTLLDLGGPFGNGAQITDSGLKDVAKLQQLTQLGLPRFITDAGLKEVSQLKRLTKLHLTVPNKLPTRVSKRWPNSSTLPSLHCSVAQKLPTRVSRSWPSSTSYVRSI
jgi:hypothetical protein